MKFYAAPPGGGGGGDGGLGPIDGGNPPGNTAPTTGGGGGSTTAPINTNPNLPEFVLPPSECKKIINLFKNTTGAKAAVKGMETLAANSNEEFKFKLANSPNIISGTGGPGTAPLPNNPATQYEFICHTHNSPAENTYSVFSGDDIVFIGRFLVNGHINASNFVLFVTTADGTKYALTISDASKLKAKFVLPGQVGFNQQLSDKYLNAFARTFSGVKPTITESSLDYAADKINFLKFLEDADMGLSMFESVDNWETFSKLNLKKNSSTNPPSLSAVPVDCL